MVKTLCVLAGGIFVGAVVMEIVHKEYPERMDKLYAKVHKVTLRAKEAFRKGYQSITEPPEAEKARA